MRKIFSIILSFTLLTGLMSCTDSESPKPNEKDKITHKSSSVLIYAVASNNLSSALSSDMNEILTVAPDLNLKDNEIYIYYLTNQTLPALYRLEYDKTTKQYSFIAKKQYDRAEYSTDPKRISRVLDDYLDRTSADTRGLIFWSHGTGWEPSLSDHIPPSESTQRVFKSYGYDNYLGKSDECDIIELADAIPENTFHYIWFDCCYMGGIEVAYQLRKKAKYMVGYSTEVWGDGMQYTLTMPYLVKKSPDLIGAAKAFSDYYIDQHLAVTVGVYDLSQIEGVAEVAASRRDLSGPSVIFMQNYGRASHRFYDLGEYLKSKIIPKPDKWSQAAYDEAMNSVEDEELTAAIDKFVIYKQSCDIDFNRQPLNLDNYYGVTVHHFADATNEEDTYYKLTDWYKRVFGEDYSLNK